MESADSGAARKSIVSGLPVIVTEEMISSRDWSRRQAPFYRVDEVAKFFFGMSASWLRLRMKSDKKHPDTWFVSDGRPIEFKRNIPGKTDSARIFSLADIQPMAESLFVFGWCSADRLNHILMIVRGTAILYDLIPEEGAREGDPAPEAS